MTKELPNRLESLDVLRGFDLFCLVALKGILYSFDKAVDLPIFSSFMWFFTHVDWQGFSFWDLLMPLFMFMSGVTIPFSLSKAKTLTDKRAVYWRIAKRVILLWIFGMMCQGNLLALNPERIYLYSNTLQAIAAGYLIAAVLFLNTSPKTQIVLAISMLLGYWGAMQGLSLDGFGNGDYTPQHNLAEGIDRHVLGRFRDGASVSDSVIEFAPGYHYTWILSTLTFGVSAMIGCFAGMILKNSLKTKTERFVSLILIGVSLVALGWIWNIQLPVIKKIWTSSMVLVSSGYCFILLALFYYLIDCRGYGKYVSWLKVFGMNSIVAYLLVRIINFTSISDSVFFGLRQFTGDYYQVIMSVCNALIIFMILSILYKQKIFLKV